MRLLHIMVRVANIDKSMKFYTELLNMNLTGTVELDDSTLYYLSDEDGQTQIELTHNNVSPEGGYTHGSGFGHFAFETDAMENFTDKMKKMGYEYLHEPFYMPQISMYVAFLKDPDGYEIEIMSKN